jgi:hypothetical protein
VYHAHDTAPAREAELVLFGGGGYYMGPGIGYYDGGGIGLILELIIIYLFSGEAENASSNRYCS